jgi:hypothetical protein
MDPMNTSMKSIKRLKRIVHRQIVSSNTVSTVNGDTWLLICSNLYFSPSTVLKLMHTSKTIWLALKDNPVWWQAFYNRVILYQSMLNRSGYLLSLVDMGIKNNNRRNIIHLVFSTACGVCGARYGHSIFKPLMQRLCQTCIHDKLISNRVLLYKYGIHFSDFIIEYYAKGGAIMYHSQPKSNLSSFQRITCDKLDLIQKSSNTTAKGIKMLFFDKDMLKSGLKIDLHEHYREVQIKKVAIQLLLGYFRRYVTGNILQTSSKHKVLAAEAVRKHETIRMIHPLKLCTIWLIGGPYYSFATDTNPITTKKVQRVAKYRRGMTLEMINCIEDCISSKAISLD